MAYQHPKTPRFYVNILEYLGAIGYTEIDNVYKLNPTEYKEHTEITTPIIQDMFAEKAFVAYLGHQGGQLSFSKSFNSDININADINGSNNNELNPEHKGFSIRSFNGLDVQDEITTSAENPIGCVVVGNYYEMPHSPELSLTLTHEYDGIQSQQTKGGSTLSNALYTKPANWGDYGAWQLGDEENYRSGRRVWTLSFSHLDENDIMPQMAMLNYETSVNLDILKSTDFFSQVFNRTISSHLPFIFQANKDSTEIDQFAICRFDMNSLKYERVAVNIYNVKLKIREVW